MDLCTSTTCSGETPDCEAKDHDYTCKCTERSCETGKQCLDGKCESCAVGTKCNCDGEKVIDDSGKCVCPADKSCAAGQYLNNDCSCKNCLENDTGGNKCGCPGNTVPNGEGGCYCKTPRSCDAGYSFDASYSCECVPCTDNASCDNPCPEGSFPNGSGCGTYACMDDSNCGEANRCENGGTESAKCVPCDKNEQCNCPDGQLSDGSGNCVSVTCKTGLTCDGSTTEQCCDAGMQCVNPDTVESYCATCETDTQCTCPAGYVVNSSGKCVKPDCTKNSDCPNGNKCDNAGKSNATCTPCAKGETCTCTGGMVSDGNGGCEFGCEFSSASACKSGTDNCSNCSMSGGCYFCSSCDTGFELSGSICSPKACPTGASPNPRCSLGQKTVNTSDYCGYSVCQKCVNCAAGDSNCGSCPAGQIPNGNGGCKSADPCADVTCDGGKICSAGSCVCPSDKPYSSGGQCRECTTDSHCGATQECSNYQCVDLNCGTCETLSNHSCKTIADCCVSDASCKANEKCIDNKCEEQCGCESFEYCKGGKCYLQAGRCYDDSNCINSDKCVSHSCVNACSPNPCSGTTPRCISSSHQANCRCSSTSCPSGYACDSWSGVCKSTTCTSDNDCVDTKKCSGGECVDPCSPNPCSGTTPRCISSSHQANCRCSSTSCPSGYACDSWGGVCKATACTSDNDCVDTKKCSGGECVDPCSPNPCSGTTPRCISSSHQANCRCSSTSCPSGYACSSWDGVCKIATTEKCTTNDDCSAEKTCSNGYCIFKD